MMMTIFEAIKGLVLYAEKNSMIEKEDEIFAINQLCQALEMDTFEDTEITEIPPLEEMLRTALDYACEKGLCEDSVVFRDLLDTRLMGVLTPRPSQVIRTFNEKYAVSPKEATDYYYALSKASDYIRTYRIRNTFGGSSYITS